MVPTSLIASIAAVRGGPSIVNKSISSLAKLNLISRTKNARYDGYRLTYGGLDYLALHALLKNDTLYSIGNQIGVGKESDIYVAASPTGRKLVIKIHRLGRISFRTVKANRDYLSKRHSGSWMHMSRLAALKEYTFMRSLREINFPVPEPVAWNRHIVVMEMIDGFPMRMVESVPEPAKLYAELIELMLRLARHGLIHGDYNEFNVLLEEQERDAQTDLSPKTEADPRNISEPQQASRNVKVKPVIIDFPQMISIQHSNAQFYFDRDVACIKRYFERRYHFVSDEQGPFFTDATKTVDSRRLDVEAEASGFSKKMAKELEGYMRDVGVDGDANGEAAAEDNADDEREEESEDNENDVDLDHDDLAAQAADSNMVDGMTVLKLSDENLSQAFPTAPSATDGASLIAGGKSRVNTAKAAKGWVI